MAVSHLSVLIIFSHGYDKIPGKTNIRKKKLILTVHQDSQGMVAAAWGSWSHCLCREERENRNAGALCFSSLLSHPGSQFVGHSWGDYSSLSQSSLIPHRHAQVFVSLAILGPVKLTIPVLHHRRDCSFVLGIVTRSQERKLCKENSSKW